MSGSRKSSGNKIYAAGDLFGTPLIPGMNQQCDIVTPEEERALIARIGGTALTPFRFQGWTGKRLTASFGWQYDFDDAGFRPGPAIPEWLLPLRARAAAFAGLEAEAMVHVLLIRYDPGAGIGWHRDRPVFGDVIGISLGADCTLRLRRRRAQGGFDRIAAPLTPRSAYHLSGEARWEWEHSIAPMDRARWSITFRTLSAKGLAIAAAV